jgi:2,3-bisphosphoglycerate-independent phosphoglycerate mutase
MKYVVVIGDGMADNPLEELEGKTPLQAAETPNMDYIAAHGVSGLLKTVPYGMDPGSDVANLSIMGYNPKECYTGRGPLEAASIGADFKENELAFRCNFITAEKNRIVDFNADHISTEEASELIEALNQHFYHWGKFYLGTSYRNLFIFKNNESSYLKSTPPHDIVNKPIFDNLIKPRDYEKAVILNKIMNDSQEVLENHPINLKRIENGKKPANMIWLWGQGGKPRMTPFKEKYGLKGATITGVDLIKGIGFYLGFTNIQVPGATGYYDTNYCGKAKYALKALEEHDIIFIHVEAPDEAGHAGDLTEKINAIERIDHRVLEKLLNNLSEFKDYSISILPDHPTPILIKTHTCDPIPYAMHSTRGKRDEVEFYDEYSAKNGSQGLMDGYRFIENYITYSKII